MQRYGWTVCALLFLTCFAPAAAQAGAEETGLSQSWVLNGSQTILADPVRPLIYTVNYQTDILAFVDSSTSEVVRSVTLGQGPTSIDMSQDGSLLYVAVSEGDCISVVDIELGTVVRDIDLGFSPFSVTVGRPDRLYVSSVDDNHWRVVDEADGTVRRTVTEIYTHLLDASPDGGRLLVITCGISPTKVNLYDISTDNPVLTASDDHDLGDNFQQHEADWARNVLYMANAAPYGLELVSLADLSRTGFLQERLYTRGVALTPDRSMVFSLGSSFYSSEVWVYDTDTLEVLDAVTLSTGDLWCLEAAGDGTALFICEPLERLALTPSLSPLAPASGSLYAYTPTTVSASYVDGLPRVEADDWELRVDGRVVLSSFSGAVSGSLPGQVDWLMADGVHWVNASALWMGRATWANWSFEIDRGDPEATRPELLPESPYDGEVLDHHPETMSATLVTPYPSPSYDDMRISLDGEPLEPFFDPPTLWGPTNDFLLPGEHTVEAWVVYDYSTMNASISWTFTVSKYQITMPEILPVYPAPMSVLVESPEYVEFDLALGYPEIEVLWLNASLNDRAISMELVDGDTARGQIGSELPSGSYEVSVTVVWDIGTLSHGWWFTVDKPWDLRPYEHDAGYVIPLPVGWEVVEDADDTDDVTEIQALGPLIDGLETTIIVQTGLDRTVRESEGYMESQVPLILEGLETEGIRADMEWIYYDLIDGHFGAVFQMRFDVLSAAGLICVVVSEEHERFWTIMMLFSSSAHPKANATFSAMLAGFEVTLEPPRTLSPDLAVLAALVVGAGVAAPIGVFLYTRRRARPQEAPGTATSAPPGPVAPPAPAGYCGACGTPQPLTNTSCPACGRLLPSPPFGAQDSSPPPRAGT